jgi:holliday junction DNA helicase RuvA
VISQVTGLLLSKEIDRIEVATPGGTGYEIHIPLSVFEKLPATGTEVNLHTHLVVKEDGWQLFGFGSAFEREVFRRILLAKGVGPGLALGMLSALNADRLVRAIREKDVALLVTVPRVGRKKADQIILDLADKLEDVAADRDDSIGGASAEGIEARDAVRAMVSLGYSAGESEKAVRAALEGGARGQSTAEIIRRSLAYASASGGRRG